MDIYQLITTIVVAILAAIPPTITALAARRSARIAVKQNDRLEAQSEKLIVKADEIHKQGNANLEKMREDLKAANDRLDEVLKTMIATVTKAAETTVAKSDTPPVIVDRREGPR